MKWNTEDNNIQVRMWNEREFEMFRNIENQFNWQMLLKMPKARFIELFWKPLYNGGILEDQEWYEIGKFHLEITTTHTIITDI